MDTTDKAQGFRKVAGTTLVLAVCKKPLEWDENRMYMIPPGYRWATTAEVLEQVCSFISIIVFLSFVFNLIWSMQAAKCTEEHAAYYGQCGWKGTEWPPGSDNKRVGFVCQDSAGVPDCHVHSASVFFSYCCAHLVCLVLFI